MAEIARNRLARPLLLTAIGALAACGGFLALAYATPETFAHSPGFARRLFMLAFLLRTFETHIGLVVILPLVVLLVLRRWTLVVVAFVLAFWTLGPVALSFVRPSVSPTNHPLRIMTANLLVGHADVEALVAQILRFEPDVIFFQEYTPAKAAKLVPLLGPTFPYRVEGMRDHAFGEAIYSKIGFASEPELYPHQIIRSHSAMESRAGGEVGIWDPQIRAVIDFQGSQIVLQNIHYAPPIQSSYLLEQRIMTTWLCEWLSLETRPVVIAGDFNCTQSSVNFADLRRAGLTDSRSAGRGWAGTWPARGVASLLPVAIDHVLVRGLQCEHSRPGTDIGSDHLPLLVIVGASQPNR